MVRLLEFLFDVLVFFLVARLIARLVNGARSTRSRQSPPTPERSGGTLVRDPQCGTYIPESRAIQARAGGTVLFFCSTTCRDAYTAAARPPAKQAAGSRS